MNNMASNRYSSRVASNVPLPDRTIQYCTLQHFPTHFSHHRCDPSIPLTVVEWEEWGNPNEAKYFAYMKSYSPLDNVVSIDTHNFFVSIYTWICQVLNTTYCLSFHHRCNESLLVSSSHFLFSKFDVSTIVFLLTG